MKIEDLRSSFTVYMVASQAEQHSGIHESLGLAGYMVAQFTELTAAFSEIHSNPPHFVLLDATEEKFDLSKALAQISAQLPETHVFLITPLDQRQRAAALLDRGVYDLILTPLASHLELVRALDRAAERDYFMYMKEEQQSPLRETPPSEKVPGALSGVCAMFKAQTAEECIRIFLDEASSLTGNLPVVYFKYVPNRRILIAASGVRLDGVDLKGLGIDFNQSADFRTAQLMDPMNVSELADLLREAFQAADYFAFPVEALNELQGLICFLGREPDPDRAQRQHEHLELLGKSLTLLESEKRLHVLCVKDPATELLNRTNFITRVREEISRARRTSLPVSLALLTLDQYSQIVSQVGNEEAQTLLKMIARIFERHSRVNDVLGRTGADEFGIVLPNTGREGAMIKAERLRRIIESADFSKVLSSFAHVTISLGVSEYPSMVRDAEELLQSADEALYQVRNVGNRTCVAKAPDGFVADFEVREKGL